MNIDIYLYYICLLNFLNHRPLELSRLAAITLPRNVSRTDTTTTAVAVATAAAAATAATLWWGTLRTHVSSLLSL